MQALGANPIMLMRKRTLRRFAVWVVVALLFTQWATAVYACPRESASAPATVPMASMPGCDDAMPQTTMDPDRPLLCKAHCDDGRQTVNASPSHEPASQAAPFLWAVLDWNVTAPTALDVGPPAAGHPAVARPATAPPVYLLLHVFRN